MTITDTTVAAHLDPARKHDFVFLFDVKDGNPNGDPDAGGMPRVDVETGEGLVTDVAIKRKIRDMVSLFTAAEPRNGYDIYVEAGVALNAQHERAYQAEGLKAGDVKSIPAAQAWMCRTFFDVRMFGAVMTTGSGKEKSNCGRVQGPMQLTFSRSIEAVLPQEHGITRVTQTRAEDIAKGETTEMGNKHTVPYGLYRGFGHFSAPLAAKTGVTSDDLAMFWRAMTIMFEHDRAATRGEMTMRGLYVFSHADAFGQVPAHRLFDLVLVPPVEGRRAFSTDAVSIDEEIPDGVALTRIVG